MLLAVFCNTLSAQKCDRIVGTYKMFGQDTKMWSRVKFIKTAGDNYEAYVTWVEYPCDEHGRPVLDVNNPNPELRKLPIDRIKIIWDVNYDSKKDMWCGGKIYNPVDGKIYDVQITFEKPDQIRVRGFVGTPMFGRSFFWDKIE